jgi:hypothetical protein
MHAQKTGQISMNPVIFFTLSIVMIIFACSSFSPPTVTATPQATSTPQPIAATATHVLPPVQIFSLDNADKVLPEDVIAEMRYFASGGGGGPTECPYYDVNSPTQGYNPVSLVPSSSEPIKLKICGWILDEKINVVIETPDGDTYKETAIASRPFETYNMNDDRSFAILDYQYVPSKEKFGKYRFTFSGDSGVISTSVFVPSPSLGMDWIPNHDGYYIYGLQPDERVRVFLYEVISTGMGEGKYSFVSWSEYSADKFGQIQLQFNSDSINGSDFRFSVIGDISGRVPGLDSLNIATINPDGSCVADAWKNDVFPTRLYVGEYSYVAFDPPLANRLRNGPGREYDVIDMVKPGVVFEILDGPECIDGVTWWKIKGIDRPFEGWTTEANEQYWLVPCNPKNKACP